MADEPRYSDEIRIPTSFTLPWSGRFTSNGHPWPIDAKGREWPSDNRGDPEFPIDLLPKGFAPGTSSVYDEGDGRRVTERFAAIDAVMFDEGRRAGERARRAAAYRPEPASQSSVQLVAGEKEKKLAAGGDQVVSSGPKQAASNTGSESRPTPVTSPSEAASNGDVGPFTRTPLPPGYKPAPGDINLLARTLFSESSNIPDAYLALGWAAVNRINSKAYGSSDTLAGVVHHPGQFQGIATATYLGNLPWQLSAKPEQLTGSNLASWKLAVIAATQILEGNTKDPTHGATTFYSNNPGHHLAASIASGKLIETLRLGVWHFLAARR